MLETIYDILTNKDHKGIAFVTGDLFATLGTTLFSIHIPFLGPMEKLLMAFGLGIFGGMGGLASKDLYEYFYKKWKNKKRKGG